LNAFLQGLNNEAYSYDSASITGDTESDPRLRAVFLTSDLIYYCNYYGIYPSTTHTAERALPTSILSRYNLNVTNIFEQIDTWLAGAIFKHNSGSGSFLALGLTRTPDIRLTAISLLSYYQPARYPSPYTASETSRLVVLQLGLVGGG
jgi:hypothetical protein